MLSLVSVREGQGGPLTTLISLRRVEQGILAKPTLDEAPPAACLHEFTDAQVGIRLEAWKEKRRCGTVAWDRES